MTTPSIKHSINRSPLRLGLFLIPLALAWFALSPTAQAQLPSPAPDGGYPGDNTAEGDGALFSLTTGTNNTAIGFNALFSNTISTSNTAIGFQALFSNNSNTDGNFNTAIGFNALFSNASGSDNTANGIQALFSNTTGGANTATGGSALYANTTGGFNTATGESALNNNTTGNNNTVIGQFALSGNTTGSGNIALGFSAGLNLTTGNHNIDIGSGGVAAEANTIRIGTQGTQTKTFVAGISGTGVSGTAVKISSSGQVGVAPSSARFKDAIKPMDEASEVILALKPVTFRYNHQIDPDGIPQFGLVAEDVEKVNPALVTRDAKGEVYTVRYEAVNAMLLNEFLKEHRKVEELTKEFQATVAQLNARLKEQAAQIQKVSAQLEASKPAPQVANNP